MIKKISFPNKIKSGGPKSFQKIFSDRYVYLGGVVSFPRYFQFPKNIIVIAGTRRIIWLSLCKLFGSNILLRLDGINWQHRVERKPIKYKIKAEIQNLITLFIANFIANSIVYQSQFVKNIWEHKLIFNKKNVVIYNASHIQKTGDDRILYNDIPIEIVCIEGELNGNPIIRILQSINNYKVHVFGKTNQKIINELKNKKNIIFHGYKPNDEVKKFLQIGRKIFLNLEINPACPNSVIEAQCAGLPILSFDSGCISELVTDKTGIILDYGSNPWNLEDPLFDELEPYIKKIERNYSYFSENAKEHAKIKFNINTMVESYLKAFNVD